MTSSPKIDGGSGIKIGDATKSFKRLGSFLHGQAGLIKSIEEKSKGNTLSRRIEDEVEDEVIGCYATSSEILRRQPSVDQSPMVNRPLPETPLACNQPEEDDLNRQSHDYAELGFFNRERGSQKQTQKRESDGSMCYLKPVSNPRQTPQVIEVMSDQSSGSSLTGLSKIYPEQSVTLQKKASHAIKEAQSGATLNESLLMSKETYEPLGAAFDPFESPYSEAKDLEAEWKQFNQSQMHPNQLPIFHKPTIYNPDLLSCPYCKSGFELPVAKQVTSLPDCYFLDGIAPVKHARPPCCFCSRACADDQNKREAEVKCMECGKYMCAECAERHRSDVQTQRLVWAFWCDILSC